MDFQEFVSMTSQDFIKESHVVMIENGNIGEDMNYEEYEYFLEFLTINLNEKSDIFNEILDLYFEQEDSIEKLFKSGITSTSLLIFLKNNLQEQIDESFSLILS